MSFDKLLKSAKRKGFKKILLTWNRGLGDVPLGLFALCHRIKEYIPDAELNFLTRPDLAPGFELLNQGKVLICPTWKRGVPFDLDNSGINKNDYDLIIENADPTKWVKWQLGKLVPKLHWNPELDHLCDKFNLRGKYMGVHVHSETTYGYQKNWDEEKWRAFFKQCKMPIILFGFKQEPIYKYENMVDLRGKTNLFEMLSVIKNHCSHLIVPDSGVLSITYYIDASFPIKIISLWADPRQGVLKQRVDSPNPELKHIPLFGSGEDVANISVNRVLEVLHR